MNLFHKVRYFAKRVLHAGPQIEDCSIGRRRLPHASLHRVRNVVHKNEIAGYIGGGQLHGTSPQRR